MRVYLLYLILPPLIEWALIKADWSGTKSEDCTKAGACWVFIRVRFDQFIYGFYPVAEQLAGQYRHRPAGRAWSRRCSSSASP